MDDKLTEHERKAQRKRRTIWAIALVMLVPIVAINVVNRIESEVPPPLWTKDEAFPTPAEADNGWSLIKHYHSTTISGIDLAPIDNLLRASRNTKLAELGRVFSPARVVASKVTKHTEICSQAFERKRMVNPCFAMDASKCSVEPIEICARLVSFAALDDAARGSARGAKRIADLLRQLSDAAANSPHPWVQARALVALRSAIHHAGVIIKWRRINSAPVREALSAIRDESLPLKQLAIASYLLKHLALRQALEQADTWLLDEGDIIRGLNAPFEPLLSGGELAPPPDYKSGTFWWFKNPIGKKMLDHVKPGADEDFVRTKEIRTTVLKRRDEALKLK